METLPTELRRKIIHHLSLPDLKSLRLVSRIWARLGSDHLLSPTFTHVPHRPSLSHLTSISQHPVYSHKIRTIRFNHGEVNEYHARHNTYFLNFLLEPDERSAVMGRAWEGYLGVKELIGRYFGGSCRREVLEGVFGRLRNLDGVEVFLMGWPYVGMEGMDVLEGIWRIPSTRALPRAETVERFKDILKALGDSGRGEGLRRLAHDRLPFEFFTQDTGFLEGIEGVLGGLMSLEVTVVEDEKNESEGLYVKGCRNLAGVLRKAGSVEELKLGFQGRTKKSIHLILESFQQDEFTFRRLRKVSFQYCTTTSKDLFDFLIRHKESLKEVQLGGGGLRTHRRPNGGVHLEDGSIKDLFERLKAEMPLCKVWVIGDLIGVESGERWLLEDRTRIEELSEYVID